MSCLVPPLTRIPSMAWLAAHINAGIEYGCKHGLIEEINNDDGRMDDAFAILPSLVEGGRNSSMRVTYEWCIQTTYQFLTLLCLKGVIRPYNLHSAAQFIATDFYADARQIAKGEEWKTEQFVTIWEALMGQLS